MMPGTAMPMKLPSGQVVWVRVSDAWDEDAADGNGASPAGSAAPQPAPGETEAPPSRPGNGLFGLRRNRRLAAMPDAPVRLHGFTDAVSGVAESVHAALSRAAPDTVEIEFGLDVDFMSGVAISLIADTHATAAVRIKLGWNAARDGGGKGNGDDEYTEIAEASQGG